MRWRMLGLLFFARVGLGLQFQTMASVGDSVSVAFGLDYADIGLLIGLFMAPGLVLALPAGYLGRYVSDRALAGLGLTAACLGGLVSAFAESTAMIGLGRALAGIGFLFGTLYFTKMVADWFEGREIATAMSLFVMSWPLGIAMGQIAHVWLAETYSWPAAFQAASLYCAMGALAVLLFYRPPHMAVSQAGSGSGPSSASWQLTRREWQLILCAAGAWAAFNACYVTYLSFGPLVVEDHGATPLAAAAIISVTSWLMIGSGALCGMIVDRTGRSERVLVICMAGAVLALALLPLPGAALGASLLFGLVGMAPAGVIMALAGQAMRPEVRAFGMGVFFTIYYAVQLAAPPIAGLLLDATGQVHSPLWLAGGLAAVVIPLGLSARKVRAPKPQWAA